MKMTRKIRRAWRRGKPEWAKQYPVKLRRQRLQLRAQQETAQNTSDRGSALRKYGRYLVASVMLAGALASWGGAAYAAPLSSSTITAADSKYDNTITKAGNTYNINPQETFNGGGALNHFDKFELANKDVANLQLGNANRLVNLVDNKVVVEGVLNALQNSKIGGDLFFFSNKGIAVGSTGVINAGRLFLGNSSGAAQTIANYTKSDYEKFLNLAPKDRADKLFAYSEDYSSIGDETEISGMDSSEANITIDGTINTSGNFIAKGRNTTVGKGAKITTNVRFNAPAANWTADKYRSSIVNTSGVQNATTAKTDSLGNIYLAAKENLSLTGAELRSNGGDIGLASEETISIKAAYTPGAGTGTGNTTIQETSIKSDGGDISVIALRDSLGTTKVDITDSTLDATHASDNKNGNVDVTAATVTRTYSWAIGAGSEAYVDLKGAHLKGDNVNVAAHATTSGELGANEEDVTYTDAQIDAGLKEIATDDENAILSFFKDSIAEARTFITATKVNAAAKVSVEDSDSSKGEAGRASELTAVGVDKDDTAETHGDINLLANARSQVTTAGYGALGYAITVGISDVNSDIVVAGNSKLTADHDINLDALGSNSINLSYLDLSLIDNIVHSSMAFNLAMLDNKVHVDVDSDTTMTAGNDLNALAKSERALTNVASSGGGTDQVGIVAGVGIIDTEATAALKGTVNVGNALDVQGITTVAKGDNGLYTPDTISSESMTGDTFWFKPLTVGAKKAVNKLFKCFNKSPYFKPAEQIAGNGDGDWGFNASTAVLSTTNKAEAYVTGKVRGVSDGAASDTIGAKSMNVQAQNISRTQLSAFAYQTPLTDVDGNVTNSKDTGVSLTVNVGLLDNTAKAHVGGDILVQDDLTVKAETKIPWETKFEKFTKFDDPMQVLFNLYGEVKDPTFGIGSLADSWSQSSGTTNKVGLAGAVGVMSYNSNSEAYIEPNATINVGKKLDVQAVNDITTVNFSGNIVSPVTMTPIALWMGREKIYSGKWWGASGEDTALGGAAITVHQQNTAKAYIADSAVGNVGDAQTSKGGITAGEVDILAKNDTLNLTVAASGGTSESVAINGTITVDRTENETLAYIGNANVTAKKNASTNMTGNVNVNAIDDSMLLNLGGALGSSAGSAGIGATIAYNHVDRDTQAYINGNILQAQGVEVLAQNTGYIISVAAAGGITYEKSAAEMEQDGTRINLDDPLERSESLINLTYDSSDAESIVSVDDANDVLNNSALNNEMQNAGENIGQGSNGFAVSANVGVNRVIDNAYAYVAPGVGHEGNVYLAPTINADYLSINSINDSAIDAVYGNVSVDLSSGNAATGIAGAFFYNSITSQNDAYVDGAVLNLGGNNNQDAENNDIDEALTITADNKEKVVNVAASGSIAPKGNAVVGQISVNRVDNHTNAYLTNSAVTVGEKLDIDAIDQAKIYSYSGAVGLSGGSFGVGAAIGAQTIDAETSAYLKDSSVNAYTSGSTTKKGAIDITAEEKSTIVSIVATGQVGTGGKFSGAFSASGNDIDTNTKAYLDTAQNVTAGAVNVHAFNHADTTVGVGQLAVGTEGASVGAGTAVVLSDNTVEAYVKGDSAQSKPNTITADSLSVQADNLYNGSASDDENATAAKTVVVGGSVSTQGFAGVGSVSVNKVNNITKAHVDAGSYSLDGALNVNATSTAKLFGLAGGVSVAGGVGLGAAVDTQLLNVTTQAYVGDNVNVAKAGDITVNASSDESITSVATTAGVSLGAFAGAGAANAHKVTSDTAAYIGTDEAEDAAKTTLGSDSQKVGAVTVAASDTSNLKANAGAAAVQVAGTGAAGTLSTAVEVLDKNVRASIGKADVNSSGKVALDADNTGYVLTTANGISASVTPSGAALTGSASETIVDYSTLAYAAGASTVTAGDELTIDADSSFTHVGEATGLAGSSLAGIGLSNDTTKFTNTTKAYAGNSAKLTAAKAIRITADHTTDITSAVVAGGLAVAGVGINGGVGVNYIDSHVHAYLGDGAEATANGTVTNSDGSKESLTLHAQDDTKVSGGSGGAAVGLSGGGGASVNVNAVNKDTQAYVGKAATLTSAGNTQVEALNSEYVYNLTMQGSGGMIAGLAGAVGVNNITAITKAYTDTGTQVTVTDGDLDVLAKHEITSLNSTSIGAAVAGNPGGVAVTGGAGVDIMNVSTQTNAFLGDSNTVTLKNSSAAEPKLGALSVLAEDLLGSDDDEINSSAVAGGVSVAATAGAAVAISGSVSVMNFGSTMSADDQKKLSNENGEFDAWLKEQANLSNTQSALAQYQNSVAQDIATDLNARNFEVVPATTGAEGTLAKIGANTTIIAGDITVDAKDRLRAHTSAGSLNISFAGEGAAVAIGASVGVINSSTKVNALIDNNTSLDGEDIQVAASADHEAASTIIGASVAVSLVGTGLAAQGSGFSWTDNTDVAALVGDTKKIYGDSLTITASNERLIDNNNVIGASVALGGAFSGSVIDINVGGTAKAGLGNKDSAKVNTEDDEYINLKGDAKVDAKMNNTLFGRTVAPSAGLLAGAGAKTSITSAGDVQAYIGQGERITAKNIAVTATATPKLRSEATGAGVGIASVGLASAITNVGDNASVSVGDGAQLTAVKNNDNNGGVVQLLATTARPNDDYNAYAKVAAGSGGGIAGVGSTTMVDLNQKTTVTVGDGVKIAGKKFTAQALHEDNINYHNTAAAAGGVTGSGTTTDTNIISDVDVSIGAGNSTATQNVTSINTNEDIVILAENKSIKNWLNSTTDTVTDKDQNTLGVGAGAINGASSENNIAITHTTDALIHKNVQLTANAAPLTDAEINAGKSLADKNAIAIDAHSSIINKSYQYLGTGSAVGAADIESKVNVTATTNATVEEGAVLQAGDVAKANNGNYVEAGDDLKSATNVYAQNVGAGSIGIGTRNDADIINQNFSTIWGAAGYSGITDEVNYTATANTTVKGAEFETANGDVRLAAGRDSSGNVGVVKIKGQDDLVNGTAIPISINPDPQLNITSNAQLTLAANSSVRSDRDVYLQANAGDITGKGRGEVKSWVKGIWGSTGGIAGKVTENKTANVEVNGSVETGIHRNQYLTIGGTNEGGVWKTQIEHSAGVGYTFTTNVEIASELEERLEKLEVLRGQYLADPAARAAYDAEIAFIQQKMVDNGLGYFVEKTVDGETNRFFVKYDRATTSELDKASNLLAEINKNATNVNNQYVAEKKTNTTQINACNAVLDAKNTYEAKVTAFNTASGELTTATTNLRNAEKDINQAYSGIKDYNDWATGVAEDSADWPLAQTYLLALSTYNTASAAKDDAFTAMNNATTAFTNSLNGFALTDGTTYADIASFDSAAATKVANEVATLSAQNAAIDRCIAYAEANTTTLSNQIAATNAFIAAGGTETNGKFIINNREVTEYEYAGQSYALLSSASAPGLKTNQVSVNDLTARLGDIKIEADNLYGAGTLNASNQANVTITNNSPNNLVVNDIKVLGGNNTATKLFGGSDVTFNGNNINSASDITKYNVNKNLDVSGLSITNKNTNTDPATAPKVTITSNFNPSNYKNGNECYYAAPSLTIASGKEIYNPNGAVSINSAVGDIYNYGAINAGSVNLEARNGDFTQGYVPGIQNVGGAPDEIYNSSANAGGITANGNIFISARYVNINGTIQSGISQWELTIPENPTLYYMDGENKVTVGVSDIAKWSETDKANRVVKIEGVSGNASESLRYDAKQGCFVVDGLEVHGGKVQIVGTIINTARDGATTGKVTALDGYGGITIKNNSDIGLVLNNISTGEGVEGVIEITDLDRATGQKTRTTTYTRKDGVIYTDVQNFANGEISGDVIHSQTSEGSTIYNPASGQYYIWQTGVDNAVVTQYHTTKSNFDIFGSWGTIDEEAIQDSTPVHPIPVALIICNKVRLFLINIS